MPHTRSLIASLPRNIPIQDRAHNSMNGGDSESYAMSRLLLACRGEGNWGSREEDNSKIDMIFSVKHPWVDRERIMVLCQVKSGATYGEITPSGFLLKGMAKSAACRTTHSICVVWVDRDNHKTFWAYIHPNTSPRPQNYGRHHEVSPATLYDLARCMSSSRPGVKNATGLHIRRKSSVISVRRKSVKAKYKINNKIKSPILGDIELTRLGWRHMFRKGRREENKSSSLDLIPYLNKLLVRHPSAHSITSCNEFTSSGFTHQVREHLLKYEKLTVSTRGHEAEKDLIAYVRAIEEIRYPNNWHEQVMLSQQISRRVVLKSAYYKKG